MCLRNTQSLVSHYFFRFRLQPSLSDSSQPGTAVSAEASRRLHLQVSSGDASSKETWRLGEFSKVLVARASGHHPLGALGSMVPARANQVVRFKWGSHPSIKGTCPLLSQPLSSHSWIPSLVRFQGLESSLSQRDPRGKNRQ